MANWDRPRTSGDSPGDGDEARQRFNPDLSNPYPMRPIPYTPWTDRSREVSEGTRGNDEGTGWPGDKGEGADKGKDKPLEIPKAPEQIAAMAKELAATKSELGKAKSELYDTQDRLLFTSRKLGEARTELRETGDERRKLVDTVSRQERTIERKDAEIAELRSPTSALARREKDHSAQAKDAADKPPRRSWFPSEKVTAAASAGVGVAGAAGVYAHQVSGTMESLLIAGAGFGFAGAALAKDWYEKGKAKRDADRPEDQ